MKQYLTLIGLIIFTNIQLSAQEAEKEEMYNRVFQLSFIPIPGAPHHPQPSYINNLSINMLAGYQGGVRGLEIGGITNIIRGGVRGLQLAGINNLVKYDVYGVQAGGISNANGGQLRGIQLAGITNLNKESILGAQFAGISNGTLSVVTGIQASGIYNHADQVYGSQISGVSNIALDSVAGAQIGGVLNIARSIKGLQLSGVVNIARSVKGAQIGLINISDSANLTLGLLNITKNGLHELGVSTNDLTPLNVSFRGGSFPLYSVLTSGLQFDKDGFWLIGLGLGSQWNFSPKMYGNVEAVSYNLLEKGSFESNLDLLNRISLNIGYELFNGLSINAGPSLNIYLSNRLDENTGQYGFEIGSNPLYQKTYRNSELRMWLGYHLGFRF